MYSKSRGTSQICVPTGSEKTRIFSFVTFHAIWSALYFCGIHTSGNSESFEITIVEKCILIERTCMLHVVSIKIHFSTIVIWEFWPDKGVLATIFESRGTSHIKKRTICGCVPWLRYGLPKVPYWSWYLLGNCEVFITNYCCQIQILALWIFSFVFVCYVAHNT